MLAALVSCLTLAQGPAKPPEVSVVRPLTREVTDAEDFTGRTEAAHRVRLRARVTGYLLQAPFKEGAEVKKDQLLFRIDPRPSQAELNKAEAALALAQARLRLVEAEQKGRGDPDKLAAAQAKAHLAKANRDAARLTLELTQVRSPLAGRIGRRLVDPGNLVRADDTVLAEIVSENPVRVYFQVDEQALLRLRKGKWPPRAVAVQLAGEKGHPHRGVVDFVSNEVDATTGTLTLRAALPNPKGLLPLGVHARVRVTVGESYKALLVPEGAVLTDQGERFVYVVNAKDVVERRPVRLGSSHDGWRVIQEGLRAEDRAVVQGLHWVRSGMAVRPRVGETPRTGEAAPKAPG
jgi:membrane fusion protein, multidrug efflux system